MLDSGVDINSKDHFVSVIMVAWYNNQEGDIIKCLIDRGAKLSAEDEWVQDALEKGYDFEEYCMKVASVKPVKRK